MSKFFIRRPIVAIVIAIVTVVIGVVSMLTLPISQYPDIVPPEILVTATYPGADAKTVSPEEVQKIKGTRILVINALQRQNHISHFTFDEAFAFAESIGAEKTYFTHISHRLGKHAEVSEALPPGIELAYDGLVVEIGG